MKMSLREADRLRDKAGAYNFDDLVAFLIDCSDPEEVASELRAAHYKLAQYVTCDPDFTGGPTGISTCLYFLSELSERIGTMEEPTLNRRLRFVSTAYPGEETE